MKTIFNSERGMTLIELLAVLTIVLSTGSVIGAIIFSAFRGSNKTNTIIDVKDNGTYALSQMQKMIEFAKVFKGVSTDNITYTTDCTQPAITPTPIPVAYKYVKITSFDDGQTVFGCGAGLIPTISSNGASLIDISKVSLASCSFTCSQTTTGSVKIDINFTLTQSGATTSAFVERKASIPFQTSVTLRNAF